MQAIMLTTVDNPYNPFTQFDDWYAFDTMKGYDTCAYLARITKLSDELSDEDESVEIENAIDEIVSLNVLGMYRKVSNDSDELVKDDNSSMLNNEEEPS